MENKIEIKDFNFYYKEAYNISDLTARCRYIRDIKDSILIARVDVNEKKEKVVLDSLIKKLEIAHATIEKERKEEVEEKLARSSFKQVTTKDNFTVWAGSEESLFTLIELLVESKLLREVEYNEINNVISSHFVYKDERNKTVVLGNKLIWGKSLSMLAYLICRLEKSKYLGVKNLQSIFSKHFFDKNGEFISNTDLSKALSQIKGRNRDSVPKAHDIVDEILNVMNGKILKENFSYFSRT